MTLSTESVTLSGSGLVFINYYDSTVTPDYRSAIITAEHQLQSAFTNPVTIGANFDLQSLGSRFAASNAFSEASVSYGTLVSALQAHATTVDDLLATGGLPSSDPSGGVGFAIPTSEARVLGLRPQTNAQDLSVTLNSNLSWNFGQDAVGAIEHEITEGAFGRIGSLGIQAARWAPMDLFRFTAAGQRDYTGGSDGVATYFGLDSAHLTPLAYHNAISATGADDGQDLADWQSTSGDAFGPGGPGSPGALSPTDLRVLDILGWNSTPYAPAADDFANSLSDVTHPFGLLAVGGSATGALQAAGDRDWFRITLQAGATYTINLVGSAGGGGTLPDPYLRLHDFTGATLLANDDVTAGQNSDSRLVFAAPASGAYYVEAGAFVDGYTGSYRLDLSQSGTAIADVGTAGNDVLAAAPGGDTVNGLAGADTITAGPGPNYLRGGDGNDSIVGGSGFNDINGNAGNDTIVGNSTVGDWLLGGQGNDSITAHGYGNIIYGNLGDDSLAGGAGNDIIRGGQGDDFILAGSGAAWVSGDRGSDTIQAGSGPDTFHSFVGAGVDRVLGFDPAKGDHVQLDPGTPYRVSQIGADTVIDMGNGDQVVLVGVQSSLLPAGWIFEA